MLGNVVSFAAMKILPRQFASLEFESEKIEQSLVGKFRHWMHDRSDARALDKITTRLEQTSPHLLDDAGIADWAEARSRRHLIFDTRTIARQ